MDWDEVLSPLRKRKRWGGRGTGRVVGVGLRKQLQVDVFCLSPDYLPDYWPLEEGL